jgi:hypothetical protein
MHKHEWKAGPWKDKRNVREGKIENRRKEEKEGGGRRRKEKEGEREKKNVASSK